MSSQNSFITTSTASVATVDDKMKRTPELLAEDLRQCLKERALHHSQYYYSLSNYPERRNSTISNGKTEQKFQEQPATLTEANLQLHNQNIKIEMKKHYFTLNQPSVNKNINFLSKSFSNKFKNQKKIKKTNSKTNNTTTKTIISDSSESLMSEKKIYENVINTGNESDNLIQNETDNKIISNISKVKLQAKSKEPFVKTKDLRRINDNPTEENENNDIELSCTLNGSHNNDNSSNNIKNCSTLQYDVNETFKEINLDNIRHNFNTCGFNKQKKLKQSTQKNSGFPTAQFDDERDGYMYENIPVDNKMAKVENNSQRFNENRKSTIVKLSDRSHSRENLLVSSLTTLPVSVYSSKSGDLSTSSLLSFASSSSSVNIDSQCKNKYFNDKNDNNKNSYESEISRGITVNRNRRQHSSNNNVIKTDNHLKKSSESFETLKENVTGNSSKNNKSLKEYFRVFQPIYQQGPLITKRKLDLFENFSNKKLNSKLRFKQQQKTYKLSNCFKNFNYEYKTFPCVDNLIKMYTQQLPENKIQKSNELNINEINSNNKNIMLDNTNVMDITTINIISEDSNNRISPISDEGCCQIEQLSLSDSEENILKPNNMNKKSEKVARSSSHDSALGLEEDIAGLSFNERRKSTDSVVSTESIYKKNRLERRNTLTIADIPLRAALLPLPQPTDLPETTINLINTTGEIKDIKQQQQQQQPKLQNQQQNTIPSKVLIEERIIEIPNDAGGQLNISRRESAQSCSSEYTNSSEYGGKRYVRTPSVVVSDYSDDVMCGITLEEIEYFRKQRMRRRSSDETATTEKDDALSDVSGASSCSNLYYCGSTISALDGADCYINGIRTKIQRKNSDCSICSNSSQISCDDEDEDDGVRDGVCYNSTDDIFNTDTNNYKRDNTQSRKKV